MTTSTQCRTPVKPGPDPAAWDLTLRRGYCKNRVTTVSEPCHVHIEPVTESYPGHDPAA
eukprot:gene25492-19952_t